MTAEVAEQQADLGEANGTAMGQEQAAGHRPAAGGGIGSSGLGVMGVSGVGTCRTDGGSVTAVTRVGNGSGALAGNVSRAWGTGNSIGVAGKSWAWGMGCGVATGHRTWLAADLSMGHGLVALAGQQVTAASSGQRAADQVA